MEIACVDSTVLIEHYRAYSGYHLRYIESK